MASNLLLLAIVAVLTIAGRPAIAAPAVYIVGDEYGWARGVNYTAWAEGKTFIVGDMLVFNYVAGSHNVYRVTGPQFMGCQVPDPSVSVPFTSGWDVITLSTPGRKWYICGFGEGLHCEEGQKLVITVLPDCEAPAPSPESWLPIPLMPAPSPVSWLPIPSVPAPAVAPSGWTEVGELPLADDEAWTPDLAPSGRYGWDWAPVLPPSGQY